MFASKQKNCMLFIELVYNVWIYQLWIKLDSFNRNQIWWLPVNQKSDMMVGLVAIDPFVDEYNYNMEMIYKLCFRYSWFICSAGSF